MSDAANILIGKGDKRVSIDHKHTDRHGLIAGVTGTGKTVTAQVLAEGFSRHGVPVFMTDIKGDLSGICQAGKPHPKVAERVRHIGIDNFAFDNNTCIFWDLYGEKGHPIRVSVSDMGPILLSRLLNLNDTQEGIITIVFRFADEEGLLLLDLKDLKTILKFIGDNAKQLRSEYGNISSASVGAIQRRIIVLEENGAEALFGEPQLDVLDLMQADSKGRGIVNVLAADNLLVYPNMYATFLLWLLSEFFEYLPESRDRDKPRFVFFIDEAHLLFDDAPKALMEKIELVVSQIRSKGVGIYFISQSPLDIPQEIHGHLGNHIQHALRAFTPKDKKSVQATADNMRKNPAFNTEQTITELGVGEALISTLGENGFPAMVERVLICPPSSRIGPVSNTERNKINLASDLTGRYDKPEGRESAHKLLRARVMKMIADFNLPDSTAQTVEKKKTDRHQQSISETLAKSVARSIGSQVGRQITRGIMGGLFGGNRRL